VQVLLDQAADLVGAKGRLLDIGSGRGELLKSARDSGWECVGIEPSSTFAEYATRISGQRSIASLSKAAIFRSHPSTW
jgi:cyclopropane fatty-acyl-phospholipid synthase-like methyltransferase